MTALHPICRYGYMPDGKGGIISCQEELPALQSHEVLLQVKAIGINRADILQIKGLYNPPNGTTPILGLECSGVIVSCGSEVKEFAIGDRVCALMAGGAYANYCIVHESLLLPMPEYLTYEAAAALPEALATSWLNLVTYGGVHADSTVVITAASGGIGTIAIQLAKYFSARTIVISNSPDKESFLRSLGVDVVLSRDSLNNKELLQASMPNGFSIAMDMVGGEILPILCKYAAIKARIMVVGLLGGSHSTIPLNDVLVKNLTIYGTTLRSLPLEHKSKIIADIKALFVDMLHHHIRPIIHASFPLYAATKAFSVMKQSQHRGKIILLPDKEKSFVF